MDVFSLRSRYALISVLLACLVLVAAASGHYLLTHTREDTALHIDNRQRLLAQSREIRNTVWEAREAVGQFLIDPEPKPNQAAVHNTISNAMASTQHLLAMQARLNTTQYAQIQHVAGLTAQLQEAAVELIAIRLDTRLQFPSLLLARDELMPRQQLVFDAFETALSETSEQQLKDTFQFQLYQLLVSARHRWSMIISNVRMLIASRLGSYGMNTIATQLEDIELLLADFNATLDKIRAMQADARIGFNTANAIDVISEQTRDWYTNYLQLIDIHNSDKWRNDVQQLHERINPLLEKIWAELLAFDAELEGSAEDDINILSKLAQQQGATIWMIGAVGLIFIILGYFSFVRSVIKPMQKLANAFMQEADSASEVELPKPSSSETRNLIRAFSEMRKQIHGRQQALEHQAQHDTLTGLANRNLLYQQLEQLIGQNKRHTDHISLILLDLDRFKEANDTLGHQIGDQLLIEVGKRLRHEMRENDIVARIGGDEFAILLTNAGEAEARNVCKKILKSFEQPFKVNEYQLYVGASLGIAVHPLHGNDAETLIKRADVAMYVAKRNRLGFAFYEATADQYDTRYLGLANDLRNALNQEALSLVYQLKYDVSFNQPIGVEALLRWEHPQIGAIAAPHIISLAEQLGIINRLTNWVIKQSLGQCATWRRQGIFTSVAINLSVYDLQNMELVDQIASLLEEYQVPPCYLVIEITENAMLIDPAHAISILEKLDSMGLRIAIDDFGAGFSSLGYLKKLPVDELKIDKSFVIDMITNENDAVIVRSTIDLAHNLGLKVVAEGVENEEIYDLLRILRCDTAQGFHLARPVDAETVTQQLEQYQLRPTRSLKLV